MTAMISLLVSSLTLYDLDELLPVTPNKYLQKTINEIRGPKSKIAKKKQTTSIKQFASRLK